MIDGYLLQALVDYPEARKQLEYQAQLRISSNRKMSSALKETSSGSNKTNSTESLLRKTLRGHVDQTKLGPNHSRCLIYFDFCDFSEINP